jgi:hypothetical protein
MVVFPSVTVDWLGALEPFGLSLSKPGRCLGAVRAEPVEALACWFGGHAWVQCGSRESPGVRVTFFCFAKRKSPKKRRPPVCDPFAVRRGKPAAGRLRGAPWNSLCAARAARTTTASQSTKHGRFDAHATPQPPRRRRSQQGVGQPNIPTAARAFASLGPLLQAQAPCAAQAGPSAAMARVDVRWVPFTMRRGAQGVGRHGRRSARASCSDSPWLSERRAQRKASSTARPTHEHRRLPAAKRRDAACRVAFSLVTFFWRSKRKPLRRRAHTPAPALNPSTPSKPAHPSFDRLSPNGRMLHPASTSSARTVGLCGSASTGSARTKSQRHSNATPFPAMAKNALKLIAKSAC